MLASDAHGQYIVTVEVYADCRPFPGLPCGAAPGLPVREAVVTALLLTKRYA
jgi:hypothetical protein